MNFYFNNTYFYVYKVSNYTNLFYNLGISRIIVVSTLIDAWVSAKDWTAPYTYLIYEISVPHGKMSFPYLLNHT